MSKNLLADAPRGPVTQQTIADLKAAGISSDVIATAEAVMREQQAKRHSSAFRPNPETVRRPVKRRRPVSRASAAQREQVRGKICVNCGHQPVDAAHLAARAQGGCDDPLCVVPLCRTCHRNFDLGELDLEPVLALREFALERSHMALHLSFEQCRRRLNGLAVLGRRWDRLIGTEPAWPCECGGGIGELFASEGWWVCGLCGGRTEELTEEERVQLS